MMTTTTEQQKRNLERILQVAKRQISRNKKEATIGDAIGISNREAIIAEFFRKNTGIEYDNLLLPNPREP
jgi:hypothetical protein